MNDKISIIIPIYNSSVSLNRCVDSLLNQTYSNLEILLIDDGSTDKSSKICDDYAKKDTRIKVYHKKNGGVSSARNLGLEKATGDYILFVDSDDILSKEWDKIIDFIDNDDIYYFHPVIDENIDKKTLIRYITGINNENIYISGIYSKSFNRRFLLKNNIKFNEKIINGEDMLFNIETAILAKKIKKVNLKYYYYRQAIGQATRKFDVKVIDSDKQFHKILNSLFENYNFDKRFANDIRLNCIKNAIMLILNRISYINNYNNAKKYFNFINEEPYKNVIINNSDNIIIKLCKKEQYRFVFYYLKLRNKISFLLKYKHINQFIEI